MTNPDEGHVVTVRAHMTPALPAAIHTHRAECSCGWFADRADATAAHAAGVSHKNACGA